MDLQNALDGVKSYCDKWQLTLNTSKTKVVVFSRGKIRRKPSFTLGDSPVEVVEDYSYLGCTFNYNNRFTKAVNKQVNQARRALYSLLSKSRNLRLPLDLQIQLFDQLVLPILLYGCEVWGCDNYSQVEAFHVKFCKQILKLNKHTPNCMAYGELGRHKLNELIEVRMVNFWCRIVNGSEFKLSNMMYKFLRVLYDQNIYYSPWLSTIKNILNKAGMSFVWNLPNSVNFTFSPNNAIIPLPWLSKAIKLRLSDMYKQDWLAEVNRNSHCKVYRMFKTSLEFEKYLQILDFRNRNYLCKFRCTNTNIPVVSGRYHNIVFHDRICNLCKGDYLGDEFHYILECAAFKNERNLFLKPYFRKRPSSIKMCDLFQSKSKSVIQNLSLFCSKIMKAFP